MVLIPIIWFLFYYDNDDIIVLNDYVSYEKNMEFEYYEEINLKDIVTLDNAKLEDENELINTTKLGEIKYTFIYIKDEEKYKGEIIYNVIDTTAPLVLSAGAYSVTVGNEIDLETRILCADNHDKRPSCKVTGDYDINTVGTYNLVHTATDEAGNKTVNDITLTVKEKSTTTTTPSTPTPIYMEDVIKEHKNENTRIGLDVSKWQGEIDFEKVKEAGAEFVIIRIAWGYNDEGENVIDEYFEANLEGAKKAGLDVGLYYYSYANSVKDAKAQAQWIVDTLDGETLELPISFDWEEWSNFNSYNLSLTDLNNMALKFINVVEEAGYEGMNYGSANYLRNMWYTKDDYKTWLAHYTSSTNYEYDYYMWQLTQFGKIDGINGDVDINVLYLD